MNNNELRIVINAKDNASNVLRKVKGEFDSASGDIGSHLENAANRAQAAFVKISKAATLAAGAAVGAGIKIGFDFNNSLEQAETKLNAFMKDGDKVAETLAWVKEEAAKTQFSFTDMANAAANLTPVAKMSGRSLEELIKQSEVLAALNPAEGLSGAVFSLREALTGDFVSIVDRFNLPRKRLNELREQGVPAIDAIRTALQEMGIDYSLVEKQGQTTAARWDQLKDKFSIFAGELSKPIFDKFSSGLDSASRKFDEMKPRIQEFTRELGEKLGPKLENLWKVFTESLIPALRDFASTFTGKDGLVDSIGWAIDKLAELMKFVSDNTWIITALALAFAAVKTAMFLSGAIEAFTAVMSAAVGVSKASAAAVTGVWGAAVGTIKGMWAGLGALIASPLAMPAIAVAAALASIAQVVRAVNEAINLIKTMNEINRQQDVHGAGTTAFFESLKRGVAEGKFSQEEANRRMREYNANFQSFTGRATGGSVAPGRPYVVGEKQAEIMTPNTRGRIQPSTEQSGMSSVVNNIYGNITIETAEAANAFFDRLDRTQRLAKVGMA